MKRVCIEWALDDLRTQDKNGESKLSSHCSTVYKKGTYILTSLSDVLILGVHVHLFSHVLFCLVYQCFDIFLTLSCNLLRHAEGRSVLESQLAVSCTGPTSLGASLLHIARVPEIHQLCIKKIMSEIPYIINHPFWPGRALQSPSRVSKIGTYFSHSPEKKRRKKTDRHK